MESAEKPRAETSPEQPAITALQAPTGSLRDQLQKWRAGGLEAPQGQPQIPS